jgi:2-hydroxy-3-keto-5-methylthiopentenyl-1-phosphate phosphatase
VVSDGFDNYISRILNRNVGSAVSANLHVWANTLAQTGEKSWEASFPFFADICVHGCATCKPAVMSLSNPFEAQTIFVGDGLSDRFAGVDADVVFAKSSLAVYCRKAGISMTEYCDLRSVAASLDQAYEAFAIAVSRGRTLHKKIYFAPIQKFTQEKV